ncbi:cytochrome C [Solemya pervernicosa gill symbiont]|uniref:Cytochrome C n=2 Tax=Gammaproteobacteria incertae sedis TaxID=118884 RepID=A0A1T2L2N6_9GAMM|nr:cytochrome c [Candidatus Reidiella endopervernicosa]OOZ39353.1 cytochrome C [Solemya pervernicosa gill symbiont]QKQ26511.1 cytochrome c [Candidatus Reidiella endopervernicosa]
MKRTVLMAVAVMLSAVAGTSVAADLAAGEAKARLCVACHGVEDVSVNPLWPSLAGQQALYMVKQMKMFKTGERKDPLMTPQSLNLSDADIENLSAYYASLKR